MFGKKRNRTRRQTANASINWIILAVVGLAFIHNFHGSTGDIADTITQTAGGAADKTIVDLKNYKNKILPPQSTILTLQDEKLGSGAPAVCGQKVTIAYTAYGAGEEALSDTATTDKPYSFTIGDGKALPAFDEGLVGMKKGGVRKIFAPANFAYGAKGFGRDGVPNNSAIRFDTKLLDISPALPDPNDTPFRFLDVRKGLGPTITCGHSAHVAITVWSVEGEKLFAVEGKDPITVTPGSSSHFLGLEHSALGMKLGGIRTAIVPPAFQKTLTDNKDALEIPFPKNQTVLVDIESVQ